MKILVTNPWGGQFTDELADEFPDIEFIGGETKADILAAASNAEIAFGSVDPEMLEAASSLRWIQSLSAGVEWMQKVPELKETDIVVTNTRGAHAATIAEHTIGMLVFLARDFAARYESQKRHEWPWPIPKASVGLMGLTMGVVGLGNIGRAVAERAAAFGMEIIAVDAHDVPTPDYVEQFWRLDGLGELMAQANVVVICTPITPETRGLISADLLRSMPEGSYLLPVSRGGIVDEATVVDMLNSGHLAGAAFDVTETEPLPENDPLWDAPNVFITPHCSPSSANTRHGVRSIIRDNLRRYLNDEPLTNIVDKRLGY